MVRNILIKEAYNGWISVEFPLMEIYNTSQRCC